MPPASRISSRQHPLVRRLRRAVRHPRGDGTVVLDGARLVRDALAAGLRVDVVLTDGRDGRLAENAARAGADVRVCTRPVLEAASPVRTPSGVVALAAWSPASLDAVFVVQPALVVGLVDVQDPGNVGSTIRSADALGATGVCALGATADPSGWKVLRGSMGSAFRLPVGRADLSDAIVAARSGGLRILATATAGGSPLPDTDLGGPVLVLFGHEGLGLPVETAAVADGAVSIPMRAGVESLNVAVAAALVLDEARRQRGGTPTP